MQSIVIIILVGLVGGIAVGLQSPLSSLLGQKLGVLESVFIIHMGGAIVALVPLLFLGGGRLSQWRSVPWYALVAGAFGMIVIASFTYMIPRIGVAGSVITVVTGQLIVGSVLDHFGLLGASVREFDPARIFGITLMMVGVWITVK